MPPTWEVFNEKGFIGRVWAVDFIDRWSFLDDELSRVLSVIGEPGIGKTWTIQMATSRWKNRPSRYVFWLNCPDLFPDHSDAMNTDCALDWLEGVTKSACTKISKVVRKEKISTNVRNFVKSLMKDCEPDDPPVLVVEGYDEISENDQLELCTLVLDHFFASIRFKIIIARRDKDGLRSDILRRSEVLLRLEEDINPFEQFEAFRSLFYPHARHLTVSNLQRFMDTLPEYKPWNQPFINAFLFDRALNNSNGSYPYLLSAVDYRECYKALIERPDAKGNPRNPSLSMYQWGVLSDIANILPLTWTSDDLETDVKKRLNHIEDLFQLGVVVYVEGSNGRYQLMQGLRSLLRSV